MIHNSEMSVRCDLYHQPSEQPWARYDASLQRQLVQTASSPDPAARGSPRTRGNQRNREVDSAEDTCWKAETQPRTIRGKCLVAVAVMVVRWIMGRAGRKCQIPLLDK